MKNKVFFSYHYKNDVWRHHIVRNIGALEDKEPVQADEWEKTKKEGDVAIKRWIDNTMKDKECLVVLIGSETANRKYVKYEIEHAWELGIGIIGIYIHNLEDKSGLTSKKGENPFNSFNHMKGHIECYNMEENRDQSYSNIKENIAKWVKKGIQQSKTRTNR